MQIFTHGGARLAVKEEGWMIVLYCVFIDIYKQPSKYLIENRPFHDFNIKIFESESSVD